MDGLGSKVGDSKRRLACILVSLGVALGNIADISPDGRPLIPAAASLRRTIGVKPAAMIRRSTDSLFPIHSDVATVSIQSHSLVSLTERQQNATPANMTTEAVSTAHNSTAGAAANSTTNASATGGHANTTLATPAATTPGNSTASATNALATPATTPSSSAASAVLPPSIATPSGPFALAHVHHGPVRHMHHQLASITPEQWPPNFCVHVKLVAPDLNTPEKERCIAILGGNKTCGSFYIFLNDDNEVGMGVRCEKGGKKSKGDSPLLDVGDSLPSNTNQSLSFCYDTQSQNASIWRGKELGVSGKKRWHFQRSGFVSIFVGSHVVDSYAQAIYEEDKAKLLDLYFSDNSTTAPRQFVLPETTTTLPPPAHHRPPPSTTPSTWEVNVNESGQTDEEAAVLGPPRRRVTTPKPWWNTTHHVEVLNTTNSLTNQTYIIRDEITTVTSYDTYTDDSNSTGISEPGGTKTANRTVHVNGTVYAASPTVETTHKYSTVAGPVSGTISGTVSGATPTAPR